ncbi:SPRY domain-containing protein 7-like [Dendronephthya gigantea]|uniref:SPRY domain-containing protein 7-like n=1 Tax=Dendronephthya gigantea TaxID=151771 RepID=UPI00106C55FB|nr:SPRY domain-containing protein 7-like [Dendronephthya gigantea]
MSSCYLDGWNLLFCCSRKKPAHNQVPCQEETQDVVLDKQFIGDEVVIVKSDLRICGCGAALATGPLVQNKAYFEVKVQCGGVWGVGLASRKCDLNCLPLGNNDESWVLRSDGGICQSGKVVHQLNVIPDDGDIIACTYNHAELYFYINGCQVEFPLTGIRGTVYPAVYVDEGAILDVIFKNFCYPPPDGYSRILFEKSLL